MEWEEYKSPSVGEEHKEETILHVFQKQTNSDEVICKNLITADDDCSHEIKKCLLLGREVMTNLDSILKNQRYFFANKGLSSQCYGFSRSHVWMWELDCEES